MRVPGLVARARRAGVDQHAVAAGLVPIPEVARFRKHHLPGHGRDPVRLVQRIQRRNLLEAGHQAFGRVIEPGARPVRVAQRRTERRHAAQHLARHGGLHSRVLRNQVHGQQVLQHRVVVHRGSLEMAPVRQHLFGHLPTQDALSALA